MDGRSVPKPALADGASESEISGFVRLVRFTIPPNRRPDLIEAARSSGSAAAPSLERRQHGLLVELDDGQWLSISITATPPDTIDDPAYLELAEGIHGDEDGAIVAVAETSTARRDGAQPWTPDGPA